MKILIEIGDLISRKSLISKLEEHVMWANNGVCTGYKIDINTVFDHVRKEQAAYDVEKVKQELNMKAERHGGEDYYVEICDALEIVEKGGVYG